MMSTEDHEVGDCDDFHSLNEGSWPQSYCHITNGSAQRTNDHHLTTPNANTDNSLDECRINVVLRVRPPRGRPTDASSVNCGPHDPQGSPSDSCLHVYPSENTVECTTAGINRPSQSSRGRGRSPPPPATNNNRKLPFTFDRVLPGTASQYEVMKVVGQPVLQRVMGGYNATVLCYGQSGCGKTHTMLGSHGGDVSHLAGAMKVAKSARAGMESDRDFSVHVGLLPRMLHELFQMLQAGDDAHASEKSRRSSSWSVQISALELYNEEIRDLLVGLKTTNKPTNKDARGPNAPSLGRNQSECVPDAGPDPLDGAYRSDSSFLIKSHEADLLKEEDGDLETEPNPIQPDASAECYSSKCEISRARDQSYRDSSKGDTAMHGRSVSRASAATALVKGKAQPSSLRLRMQGESQLATGNSAVYVEGMIKHPVYSYEEALHAVLHATRKRAMGATKLNLYSSRSHTIYFVYVQRTTEEEMHAHAEDTENGLGKNACGSLFHATVVRHSVLTLVDLAGSERVGHTGVEGLRLEEARRINLSLSLLGNVIRKLSTSRSAHIPYRDSKLTSILHDSFGGNAITYLLCMVSPDVQDVLETTSTLRFASLAKKVKNVAVIKQEYSVQELKKKLEQAIEYIAHLEVQLREASQRAQALPISRHFSHAEQFTSSMVDLSTSLGSPHVSATSESSYMGINDSLSRAPSVANSSPMAKEQNSTDHMGLRSCSISFECAPVCVARGSSIKLSCSLMGVEKGVQVSSLPIPGDVKHAEHAQALMELQRQQDRISELIRQDNEKSARIEALKHILRSMTIISDVNGVKSREASPAASEFIRSERTVDTSASRASSEGFTQPARLSDGASLILERPSTLLMPRGNSKTRSGDIGTPHPFPNHVENRIVTSDRNGRLDSPLSISRRGRFSGYGSTLGNFVSNIRLALAIARGGC